MHEGTVRATDAARSESVPALDETVLAQLGDQIDDRDGSAVRDLIKTYVLEASECLLTLTAAVKAGDIAKTRRTTHTWSSTSAAVGAMTLALLLKQTEVAVAAAPDSLDALIDRILSEHERVTLALRFRQYADTAPPMEAVPHA